MGSTVDDTMSDDEFEHDDPVAHQKLIAAINSTVRTQDVQKPTRTEPTNARSEFDLFKTQFTEGNTSHKPAIKLHELVGILKKTEKNASVVKELLQINAKKKTLDKPLEKPVADRIERDTLYGKAQEKLDLWEPVVTANDVAPQTVYPLQYGRVDLVKEVPQKLSQYRVKSDLMKAMEELDRKYQEEEVEEEKPKEYALTLEEQIQRRKETARQKMREAYKIAKGRRLNKIKSKKFHRLLKREKIRNQMKQFEELQKTDPEAALKQLQMIEKQRYQERATLRHKNTGSWAKNMQIRAKYDMNVRQELEEQLSIGKELMAKRLVEDESSESGEEEVVLDEADDDDNPWVRKKGNHEEEANREFTSGYRKYWEQRNNAEKVKKQMHVEEMQTETVQEESENDETGDAEEQDSEDERQLEMFKKKVKKSKPTSTSDWNEEDLNDSKENPVKVEKSKLERKELNIEEMFDDAQELLEQNVQKKIANIKDLTKARKAEHRNLGRSSGNRKSENKLHSKLAFKKKASLADADISLEETTGKQIENSVQNVMKFFADDKLPESSSTDVVIDPKKFVEMKPKHLLNAIPDLTTGGELSDDENPEHNQKMTIAEAFEDDDIVADFEQEKQNERDRNQPKEVDMTLPGWGSWGGCGIKQVPKTRRKMFKTPPVLPRRDDNKERVIINEDVVSKKLSSHLVNELPFPFVSVKDYEASIRAPLGRTFVPETAHLTLVEPRVVTKMGAIIEPMKKEILLQDVKKTFHIGARKFNKATKKYEEFLEQNELSKLEQH